MRWSGSLPAAVRSAIPLALLCATGCPAAGSDPLPGVVQGVVRRVHDQPVAFAKVEILGAHVGAHTSEDGSFRIPAVPPGRWQLVVDAMGFPKLTRWIVVAADDTLHETLRLPPGLEDAPLLLRDSLRSVGRWPPYLDPRLEARMREARN